MALPCFALCLAPFLIVLVHQPRLLVAVAQSQTNLTAGTALTPPSRITSPSGDFAFGFRALDSDPAKFLLATWFHFNDDAGRNSSQPQSVVWFAKQSVSGDMVVATAQSVLSVTLDGQLTLADTTNGGNRVFWSALVANRKRGTSVLVLRDSGNLQFLGDGGGRDNVLWESFRYPTDTLLPGQSLAMDDLSKGKLFSKRADAEFTTGRFSMGVQTDGNVVLYVDLLSGNSPDNAYWEARTNSPDGNTTVTFDELGCLNYTLGNGNVQSLISSMASSTVGKNYRFARMDPDGIVRAYVRPKNAQDGGGYTSWTVSGAFPIEGCNMKTAGLQGMCGPGSYCVETSDRLNCVCPSGYTYTDVQYRDSGCTPEFVPQSCDGESNSGEFALEELPNTTWETSIYYKKFSSITEDQCRDYCLNDSFCAAALVIDGTGCVEVAVLTNGRQANGVTTKALIKVRASRPPVARTRTILRYIIVAVCLAFLLVATIGGFLAHRYLTMNKKKANENLLSARAFTYNELKQATNGFRDRLGSGGFGLVYRGVVKPPQSDVAVKELNHSDDYKEKEFTNEVQSIGRIHHRNLVGMIGYCKERKHRILVFDFMPGGSLGDLMNRSGRPPWRWLAEAALGIARGLEYLHDGCTIPIIHCDIKPDNILLDRDGAPRITDFGISKLLSGHKLQHTITKIMGTKGYIAPEWFDGTRDKVDSKVDVYSFGVVLLEMICWKKTFEEHPPDDQSAGTVAVLKDWAEKSIRNGRTELLVQGESQALEDMESVDRFARVAIWCVQTDPSTRPAMREVVQMLRGTVKVDPLPDPPRPPDFSSILSVDGLQGHDSLSPD